MTDAFSDGVDATELFLLRAHRVDPGCTSSSFAAWHTREGKTSYDQLVSYARAHTPAAGHISYQMP